MEQRVEPPRRRWGRALAALAAALGVTLGALALQVDDWSRDLTVNPAATHPAAPAPALRPVRSPRSAEALAEEVLAAAAELPGWRLSSREAAEGGWRLRFVRTSRLFRFKDDIVVRVREAGGERIIEAEARSRVGKGDLGQNPRSLKALLGQVRARLQDPPR